MRRNRLQLIAVAVLCLLVAGIAQAQFGKLKSLAKEKLKAQPQEEQKSESVPATASRDSLSEDEGEVKATYAPGVQKSLDVWRKGGPTPEATGGEMESGRKQTISLKFTNVDARLIDSVRSYKPCNKLEGFQIVSPTEVKVSVDLTGSTDAASDTCYFNFRSAGKTVLQADVEVLGQDNVKQKRRDAAMQQEMQLPAQQQLALARQKIGKLWTVQFANGKTDRWALVGPSPEDDTKYRFKAANQQVLDIGYTAGTAIILMGECMMQAVIEDKSVEGTALTSCSVPMGTRFTATVQ